MRLAEQAERVFAVYLAQNVVRKMDPVDVPAALAGGVRGVLEVFVGGFEKAVIEPVHFDFRKQVCSEEDAVGKFEEEFASRIRLAAEFRCAGADVDDNSGIAGELLG